MTEDNRSAEVSLEVPGPPEEVWRAIATGPGITAWFVPAEVEEREGGKVTLHLMPGFDANAEVTAFEPPHRFVYTDEWEPAPGLGSRPMATEFLVEAKSGGTCVVRIIASGFGTGEDWDKPLESVREGWAAALETMRLYLTHFRGQPCAPINVGGTATAGPREAAFERLRTELGLASAAVGERVQTSGEGVPRLAGEVIRLEPAEIQLLLDEPAPGIAYIAAGGAGDEVFAIMRGYLFGDGATAVAAREEPRWREWIGARVSPVTSG
jgi:uncharacterized protein YndB with AHSA1/START domain